ncbi:MAG: alanine racemase [Erysipelotrichaceae bacterium]|nr:alanine racemase [Erysipelotrichaceae bacterium]
MFRNTYLQIDLDKLRYNIDYFLHKSDKKMMGVVKADGYGSIDYMEAKILEEKGVDFFAVSSLDEALCLRKHDIRGQILILGYVPEDALDLIRKNDFSIVTYSPEFVKEADLKDVKVHLKLNTGMNRLGIRPEEAKEILDILLGKGSIVEGVMSHFSSADFDEDYSIRQYRRFGDCVLSLDHDFRYIHMSATDGSILIDDDICNYERIGIGLLGYSSYETELKPCLGLYSEAVMTKQLSQGDTVSYGRHYTSDGKGYILTVPIGYADGFYRSNTGKQVYVDGEYGTIVGSVCMDQLMVLTEHEHLPGTKVELFGEHISIVERAKELNTITYELLTGLTDRVSRVYLENGQIVKTIDPRFSE